MSLFKKALAECIGTAVLVFVACGVAVVSGNWVAISLAFGLVIVAMAYSIGNVSGCHINHAVSIAMLVRKKITLNEFIAYVCGQVVGAFVGSVLLGAFLREAKESGVYALYYIDLATGLRRGELLGLKWEDIDLDQGVIHVQRQVARVNGEVKEVPLKTKHSYRNISISQDAAVLLREMKKHSVSDYVFPSPTGGPISPDSVRNMLRRVLKRAGLPALRFHDLRHSFATLALQNGVDIKTVSGMLGHFSAGFTLDTYAHVTTAAQREAANTMGNVLSI